MSSVYLDEKAIFNVARNIESPDARAEYLQQACGTDFGLRDRVEVLLRAYEEQTGFLESPPGGSDFTTTTHHVTEQVGDTIGPYKLLQQIAEGGMGVVFLAEQEKPVRRRVALKIIKPGMDTRAVTARFEAERQALAMMDHPNIAKVLDAGTTDTGRPYFVMELVKGLPITQYCDQQKLPPRERLELFVPVCQAVQHAHQKGIIHRDLKPSNVLVTHYDNRPVPKIIDFGVAKAIQQRLTEKTMFTELGQVVGTLEYMSPEQARFNQLDVDTRTDVYSLGVLLYELLVGETPFDHERLRAAAFDDLLRIIREEEFPRPSLRLSTSESLPSIAANRHVDPRQLNALVKGELDWIVMKALEKERSRRYETASKFAEDVQHYLNDEPVEACPPSAMYRLRKLASRHRLVLAAASVVGLAMLIGAAVSTWQMIRAMHSEKIANQQRQIAEESAFVAEEQKRLALRQHVLMLTSLYVESMPRAYRDWQDGNINGASDALMAFLPNDHIPDLRNWEWYYLASLLEEDNNVFHPNLGMVREVYYSPDGDLLAVGGDHGAAVFDARSMRLVRSLPGNAPIAWHPREPKLAAVTKEGVPGELTIWDIHSGAALRRIKTRAKNHHISWRPDGKGLAWGGDKTFEIWREDSGMAELHDNPRQGNRYEIYSLAWSPDATILVLGLGFPCELQVWSDERNEFLEAIHVSIETAPHCMDWSVANGRLALGTHAGGVYGWHVEASERAFYIHAAHGGLISALSWSPHGNFLASGGNDCLVRIWDAQTLRQVNQFAGHRDAVRAVAWSPDGTSIVSGGTDGTVRLWRRNQNQSNLTFPGARTMAWSPDGRKVATIGTVLRTDESDSYELALVYDAETGKLFKELKPHLPPGGSRLSWSPDGKLIGVASLGVRPSHGAAHLWDAKSGNLVYKLTDNHSRPDSPFSECRCITWSPDSQLFATCGSDNRIKIWETVSGKLLHTLEASDSDVTATVGTVCWSPDGEWFLSADWGRHVKIWDTRTWDPLWDIRQETATSGAGADGTFSSAWSPESHRIATRSGSGNLVVWELTAGQEPRQVWIVRAHTSNIRSIAWSPDGQRIATGSEDSKVKIWDAATGRDLLSFDLEGWVQTVAWSPDGTRLAAVDESENAVHIWDARKALRVNWKERQARLEMREAGPTR